MKHSDTCAIGARAEERGPCNCGADERVRPWRIRPVAIPEPGSVNAATAEYTLGIMVQIDRDLTTREAMDLALTLQHLTIDTSHRNIVAADRRARKGKRDGKR